MLDLDQLDQRDARLVQLGLKAAGFYTGTTRGLPGKKTRAAYVEYLSASTPKVGAEPPWMLKARAFTGLREIPGPRHEKRVVRMWEAIKAPFRDDETPWCAAFVGAMLEDCGIRSTRRANARSYTNWGVKLARPAQGAVVVFWRGSRNGWKGHVGFVDGVSDNGDPWCLGGNQGNAVNVKRFQKSRVLGYYWPHGEWAPSEYPARRKNTPGQYSNNES